MPAPIGFQKNNKRLLSGISALSAKNWQELQSLQPDPGDYYPASATLRDGEIEPCVMFVEKDSTARKNQFRQRGFIRKWYLFDDFHMIDAELVGGVIVSPFVTPARIFRLIHKNPNPRFGYGPFVFRLRDGTEFIHCFGNFIEFCSVPEGYTAEDIISVEDVDEYYDSWKDPRPTLKPTPFKWCVFRKPE